MKDLDIIESKIYLIQGKKVMLDHDLSALYGVETKYVNLAVRRNKDRFPDDFMFRLTEKEMENLRLQFATSSLKYEEDAICPMFLPKMELPCSRAFFDPNRRYR